MVEADFFFSSCSVFGQGVWCSFKFVVVAVYFAVEAINTSIRSSIIIMRVSPPSSSSCYTWAFDCEWRKRRRIFQLNA